MVVKISKPVLYLRAYIGCRHNRYVATALCPTLDYVFVFSPSLRTKNNALNRENILMFVCLSVCIFICDLASVFKLFIVFS